MLQNEYEPGQHWGQIEHPVQFVQPHEWHGVIELHLHDVDLKYVHDHRKQQHEAEVLLFVNLQVVLVPDEAQKYLNGHEHHWAYHETVSKEVREVFGLFSVLGEVAQLQKSEYQTE